MVYRQTLRIHFTRIVVDFDVVFVSRTKFRWQLLTEKMRMFLFLNSLKNQFTHSIAVFLPSSFILLYVWCRTSIVMYRLAVKLPGRNIVFSSWMKTNCSLFSAERCWWGQRRGGQRDQCPLKLFSMGIFTLIWNWNVSLALFSMICIWWVNNVAYLSEPPPPTYKWAIDCPDSAYRSSRIHQQWFDRV